jgi:LacI family transcriptional regulator
MKRSNKTTIRDVAQLAQVSTATVSHVINGTHFVSPKLEERVLKAIETLEYRPNKLAKALSSRSLPLLALVVPDISNPYWSTVTRAIQEATDPYGYSVIVCSTDGVLEREIRFLQTLSGWVSGLIIHPYHITHEHVARFMSKDLPVVILGDFLVDEPLPATWDRVGGSNLKGAQIAVEHLLALGHQRIAFIQGPKDTPSGMRRLEGYLAALANASLPRHDELIQTGDYSLNGGRRAMESLLALADPPSAVFCANDFSAFGALHAAHRLGIKIPANLSVVGFDDVERAEYSDPPLTTIRQSPADLGEIGAKILLERLEKGRIKQIRRSLELSLIKRQSTAPPG